MTFFFEDAQGKFTRQYSIVVQKGRRYTFTIKLGEWWRGASVLRNIALKEKIRIGWIYGKFLLQETDNPKIFIATGTGLAPIYHMIRFLGKKHQKILYFSVATEEDLFYVEKLQSLENLELHIHVTREKVDGYEEWRVDVDTISASWETEWYLCGNPQMVMDTTLKLQARGFDAIFSEEFS
jgi:ferredoxin-NADP reductase